MSTSVPRGRIRNRVEEELYVATAGLSMLVQSFVEDWHRQHPDAAQRARVAPAHGELRSFGAIRWLEQEAAVPRHRLDTIARNKSTVTDLATADAVVQAIGAPHAFHDGTLLVGTRRQIRQANHPT